MGHVSGFFNYVQRLQVSAWTTIDVLAVTSGTDFVSYFYFDIIEILELIKKGY